MPRYVALGAVIGFAITVLLVSVCGRDTPPPSPVASPEVTGPRINRLPLRAPLTVGHPVIVPKLPGVGVGQAAAPDAGP